MQIKIKNNENTVKNEGTLVNFWLNKENCIYENQKSVLLSIPKFNNDYPGFSFWLNKKFIFVSNYTNIVKIGINNVDEFDYSYYLINKLNNRKEDFKNPDGKLKGTELAIILKSYTDSLNK